MTTESLLLCVDELTNNVDASRGTRADRPDLNG